MLLKIFLFLLLLSSRAYSENVFPGEYWVITEQDGTVIRVVSKQELPTPNENEQKLFKVISVEFQTEQEYYDFVNPVMEQQIIWADPNKTIIKEALPDRVNKLDVSKIEGKKEEINVNTLEESIAPVAIDNAVISK